MASQKRQGRTKCLESTLEARSDSVTDTHPKVEAFLIDGYRRMSPAQKMARVTALTQAVQELALTDIRRRHPTASVEEQSLRLASRWLDSGLMRKAFGWDVDKAGY
jgi:hypothetical protein